MNIQDVQKYFGTPLNRVPKPKMPFGSKDYQVIIAIVVVGFAVVGAIAITGKISNHFKRKDKKSS